MISIPGLYTLNTWIEGTSTGKQIKIKVGTLTTAYIPVAVACIITVTSWWARWTLKSPVSRLFAQPFVQVQINEDIKTPLHWSLWGESIGERWIPLTKGINGKCIRLTTSWYVKLWINRQTGCSCVVTTIFHNFITWQLLAFIGILCDLWQTWFGSLILIMYLWSTRTEMEVTYLPNLYCIILLVLMVRCSSR